MTEPLAITVQPNRKAPQNEQAYEKAKPAPQTLTSRLGRDDVASLVVEGSIYERWTSILVSSVLMALPGGTFVVTLAEPSDTGKPASWSQWRIKPGDRATLYLAGHKAVDGYVIHRDTETSAGSHGVVIEGASADVDLTAATAKHRQFDGYTFEAIVKAMLKDAGVPTTFRMENRPKGVDQPFDRVVAAPQASLFWNIERLAKARGVYLYADVDGNLVGTAAQKADFSGADLKEGLNILAARVRLSNEHVMAKIMGVSQTRGTDQRYGRAASEIAALGGNPNARPWLTERFRGEVPSDPETMRQRVNFQLADSLYTSVDAQVTVQGWRQPNGQLWRPRDTINVDMPSHFPANQGRMTLALRSVTFSQSNAGTTTTLGLCLRQAIGAPPDPGVRGEAPNLLSAKPDPAQPLSPPP